MQRQHARLIPGIRSFYGTPAAASENTGMKRDLGLAGISITDFPWIDLATGSQCNDRAISERELNIFHASELLAL